MEDCQNDEDFEDDKFADLEGFDGTCPHCGSDEDSLQEIDRWIGDKNDTFELCPDQSDRLLVRRYLCWECDETFHTGELDGIERFDFSE